MLKVVKLPPIYIMIKTQCILRRQNLNDGTEQVSIKQKYSWTDFPQRLPPPAAFLSSNEKYK